MSEAIEHSSKQIGDWGEHWVALQLLQQGWQVKFLGDAVPSYDMIAYHREHGGRTVQVKTVRRNTGAIDLGPQDTFTADVLIFVFDPMNPATTACIYPGDMIRNATTSDMSLAPFVIDRNANKRSGKIHVWTRNNTKTGAYFPTETHRGAWHFVASCR